MTIEKRCANCDLARSTVSAPPATTVWNGSGPTQPPRGRRSRRDGVCTPARIPTLTIVQRLSAIAPAGCRRRCPRAEHRAQGPLLHGRVHHFRQRGGARIPGGDRGRPGRNPRALAEVGAEARATTTKKLATRFSDPVLCKSGSSALKPPQPQQPQDKQSSKANKAPSQRRVHGEMKAQTASRTPNSESTYEPARHFSGSCIWRADGKRGPLPPIRLQVAAAPRFLRSETTKRRFDTLMRRARRLLSRSSARVSPLEAVNMRRGAGGTRAFPDGRGLGGFGGKCRPSWCSGRSRRCWVRLCWPSPSTRPALPAA